MKTTLLLTMLFFFTLPLRANVSCISILSPITMSPKDILHEVRTFHSSGYRSKEGTVRFLRAFSTVEEDILNSFKPRNIEQRSLLKEQIHSALLSHIEDFKRKQRQSKPSSLMTTQKLKTLLFKEVKRSRRSTKNLRTKQIVPELTPVEKKAKRDAEAINAIVAFYKAGFKTKLGTQHFRQKLDSIKRELLETLPSSTLSKEEASIRIDAALDNILEEHRRKPQVFANDSDALSIWEEIKETVRLHTLQITINDSFEARKNKGQVILVRIHRAQILSEYLKRYESVKYALSHEWGIFLKTNGDFSTDQKERFGRIGFPPKEAQEEVNNIISGLDQSSQFTDMNIDDLNITAQRLQDDLYEASVNSIPEIIALTKDFSLPPDIEFIKAWLETAVYGTRK